MDSRAELALLMSSMQSW